MDEPNHKVKCFKVMRPDCGNKWCVYRTGQGVDDAEFTDSEVGDKIIIEVIEMTESELETLPEFQGW
jgi:hypothetical protein